MLADTQPAAAAAGFRDVDFAHTGPDTLAGRYLRRFWQPVYLSRDLAPGHAVPLRIMGEDFTLYRGESGTPHVTAARCAHRGTQLSTGWVEGDCIRCFYHGWKYDGSGQCVEQPAEEAGFASKVRIKSYPTEDYLGFVFAHLGDAERGDTGAFRPPPLPRYPDIDAFAGILVATQYLRRCNYFQTLENNHDTLHVYFVHAAPPFAYDRDTLLQPTCVETEWGTMSTSSPAEIRPSNVERVGKGNQFGMPNILHIKGSPPRWTDHLAWRVPVDDDSHLSFNLDLYVSEAHVKQTDPAREAAGDALAEAILAGQLGSAAIQGRRDVDVINVQDQVALLGQGAIADRTRERLGRADAAIIVLRQIWARELRALAEGRPLKDWKRPDWLVGSVGPDA